MRTAISIRYLSDIISKAARDARAFQKLERVGKKSLRSLSQQASKSLKDLGRLSGKLGGLGAGGAVAGGAFSIATTGAQVAGFKASAGLTNEEAKKLEQASWELGNALNTSTDNLIALSKAMQAKIGDIDIVQEALTPTAYAARGSEIINRPEETASLAHAAYLAGARTAHEFGEYLSKEMVAGQSGSFTLEEQANVVGQMQAAKAGYLQGQRPVAPEEFSPYLQSARNYFGSAERLMTGFESYINDLYASPTFNGVTKDAEGNIRQFGDVLEMIYQKLNGDIDKIYNLDNIQKPTQQFLQAYFIDRAGDNKSQTVKKDIEATEGSQVITKAAKIASGDFLSMLHGTGISMLTRARYGLPDGVDAKELANARIKPIAEQPQQQAKITVEIKAAPGTQGRVQGTETRGNITIHEKIGLQE